MVHHIHRMSQFCQLCPSPDEPSPVVPLCKFLNSAWRSYTSDDIESLNSALLSPHLLSDDNSTIFEILSRFFPNHPLVPFASSLTSERHGRGHPVVIQFNTSSDRSLDLPDDNTFQPSDLSDIDSDITSPPSEEITRCCQVNSSSSMAFEFSAGLCVVRKGLKNREALIIRREGDLFYEVPKGHLEEGESLQQAAERELREETGILNDVVVGEPLLSEIYTVRTTEVKRIEKTVHYFRAELMQSHKSELSDGVIWSTDLCANCIQIASSKRENEVSSSSCCCAEHHCIALFGDREDSTSEIKWVTLEEVNEIYWKSNTTMNVVVMALN